MRQNLTARVPSLPVGAGRWCGLRCSIAAAAATLVAGALAPVSAADAPGAPGGASAWTTGAKQGLGTSTTPQSKVWYTIARGVLTEVYFPQIDTPNVQDLQLIVTDGTTFVDLERDKTTHEVGLVDTRALTYRQINTATSGRYRITRTLVTDPDRPVLLMQTRFQALSGGPYQVYVLHNPSLAGSGKGDIAATSSNALVASKGAIADALVSSLGFTQTSNGYSGTASDGLVDLNRNKHLTMLFNSASTPGATSSRSAKSALATIRLSPWRSVSVPRGQKPQRTPMRRLPPASPLWRAPMRTAGMTTSAHSNRHLITSRATI